MPADAISMENMSAVELHRSSIRRANVTFADVINFLIICIPLKSSQLIGLNLCIFERFDVAWSLCVLCPVLPDLDHAANGDADDQQS